MDLQRVDEMLNHTRAKERRVEAHLEHELADRASKHNRRNTMAHISLLHLRHFPTDERGAVYLNYGLSVNPNTYEIFDDGNKI